mgnify:FL=1
MPSFVTPSMESLARAMKHHARSGLWDGRAETAQLPYFDQARREHAETGTVLLFTREDGYHSSGWWKNPDYERCYHLSISFWDLQSQQPRPFETRLAEAWVRCFFVTWTRYVWEEGPSMKLPAEVRHYRVFCDPAWQPILPRGEVYTRDFVEKGWKSWSDQQWEKQQRSPKR